MVPKLMASTLSLVAMCALQSLMTLVLLILSIVLILAWRINLQAGDGIGHRAGWEGFEGEYCENTIEGMRALVALDNGEGVTEHFPFLEFDVQETQDGQLVVFHDACLTRAFPATKENTATIHSLANEGVDWQNATVQDLSLSQLQSLHLGGREGLRVPLFKEFLRACVAVGIRRTLAIEVKLLLTDKARQELIDTIRLYLEEYTPQLNSSPWVSNCYKPLGWASVIAFPHLFALSFGEFGSSQWKRWASEFRKQKIRARACHFHDLSLIYMP